MIWDDWKRLTRLMNGIRLALDGESAKWNSMQLINSDKVTIGVKSGDGKFEISLDEYIECINDREMVLGMGVVFSYAVAEAAAEDILGVQCNDGIETWGTKLLGKYGCDWSKVLGGKEGAVEVAVIRNLIAHGSWKFDDRSLGRLSAVNYSGPYKLGDPLKLDYSDYENYRSRLRSIFRTAGIVHPDRLD